MTARYADRVALMSSEGRIAETGDPRKLTEDQGSRLSALINKVNGSICPTPGVDGLVIVPGARKRKSRHLLYSLKDHRSWFPCSIVCGRNVPGFVWLSGQDASSSRFRSLGVPKYCRSSWVSSS